MSEKTLAILAVGLCLLAAGGSISCSQYDLNRAEDYVGATRILTPATTSPASQLTTSTATTVATTGPAPVAAIPASGPISLNVATAVLLALNNNSDLAVEKYNPPIRRAAVLGELAVFDPTLSAAASLGRTRTDQSNIGGPTGATDTGSMEVALSEFLPTGTQLEIGGSTDVSSDGDRVYTSRVEASVTQLLLRGAGLDVNLARVRQARIDVDISLYELRGLAMSIVADTEKTFWDYALARRQIEIVTQSLELAQKQLDETNERIRVGRLAETERAASEAEVALRKQDLIDARSDLERTRLLLLRLISAPGQEALSRDIVITQQPLPSKIPLEDMQQHLEVARRMRPELNQARLQVNREELELVKTRNGLLPRLDLFVALGKTGFAESFGSSVKDIGGDDSSAFVGLSGEYQLTNRTARASHTRATLVRDQGLEALDNLWQLVEVDVRTAYIEVQRAGDQVEAAAATMRLQESKLQAELGKFRVNKSTSLQVAQVQRDLLASQINHVQAVAAYLKAFVDLYRLEGSLLERRGITAPGNATVTLKSRAGWKS